MIARLWTASYDSAVRAELEAFAQDRSLPFLRGQAGNKGVIYLAQSDKWITMTLWEDEESYIRMEATPAYRQISDSIQRTGAILDVLSVEVFDLLTLDVMADVKTD